MKGEHNDDNELEYLLILDFEAICVEDHLPKPIPQEIIEFPVILFDLHSHSEIDRFHCYVKPQQHTKLSEFCTRLTGITQDTIDNNSITFEQALEDHENWLLKHELIDEEHNKVKNWMYVTDGDWDLMTCIVSNCAHFNYHCPSFCDEWINVRNLFIQQFPESGGYGISKMVHQLGLTLEGNQHSGIDDCVNILNIVKSLITLGTTPDYSFKSDRSNRQLPPNFKPGDWMCSNHSCQEHNFASRKYCHQCTAAKPNRDGNDQFASSSPPSQKVLPGDWFCSQCNYHNFRNKMNCSQCNNQKPGTSGNYNYSNYGNNNNNYGNNNNNNYGGGSMLPRDWSCPSCNFHNFRNNVVCKRCNVDRNGGGNGGGNRGYGGGNNGGYGNNNNYGNNGGYGNNNYGGGYGNSGGYNNSGGRNMNSKPTGGNFKPGDWYCSKCNYHNFRSNYVCKSCGGK